MIDKQKLSELKSFVSFLEQNPSALQQPELEFFRRYMESHGAKFEAQEPCGSGRPCGSGGAPPCGSSGSPCPENGKAKKPAYVEEQISEDEPDSATEESDEAAFIDDPNRLDPEFSDPCPLCEDKGELNEDQMDQASDMKQVIADKIEAGDLEGALSKMNELFVIANPSALLYCKRADLLLKLKRPVGAIRDCDEALKLNSDYGRAYRVRGTAHRYLGNWEDAHNDIETGQKIDYDDSLSEIQKFVADKWTAIAGKRRSSQRRREERAMRNKIRQRRRAQAAAKRAYEQDNDEDDDDDDDMPRMPGGGFGGFGGEGDGGLGGMGSLLGKMMSDPEMKKLMENPRVLKAVMELMQDPASISKYQKDEEVMSAFAALAGAMGGGKPSTSGV